MMPTALDDPVAAEPQTAATRLRVSMAAVRLAFTWLGVRRTLTRDQKAQAADTFGAEGDYLSAAKKLLDTSHTAYRAVNSVKHQAVSYWRSISLPYPEPGIRLIRQSDVDSFNDRLGSFQSELAQTVEVLQRHYSELKSAARERLG